MQTAALPVGERERAPLTLPPRRYPRGVARPRHAPRPTPLLSRSSSARSPASPLLHRNTSPNAVVYSWSTHQLLGHPRGLAGVSEVEFLELRKAQRYGRDPRNGHSTIYCISKAGIIYKAVREPMYELLMQNMRALEQVGRGETCDRRDDSPTKADAGPARRQPRAERSRACSSRPCVVVGAKPAVRRRGRGAGRASSWARI